MKLSLLLAIVLLILGSAYAIRDGVMVLHGDSQRYVPGKKRCMAMIPGCMGQEAYDRWINSRKPAVVAITASLDDNDAPVIEKRKEKRRNCKALTPGCMGQKAYDAYMERRRVAAAVASLDDNSAPVSTTKRRTKIGKGYRPISWTYRKIRYYAPLYKPMN